MRERDRRGRSSWSRLLNLGARRLLGSAVVFSICSKFVSGPALKRPVASQRTPCRERQTYFSFISRFRDVPESPQSTLPRALSFSSPSAHTVSPSPASTSVWWSDYSHMPRLVVSHSTCPPISSSPSRAQLSTRSCSNKQHNNSPEHDVHTLTYHSSPRLARLRTNVHTVRVSIFLSYCTHDGLCLSAHPNVSQLETTLHFTPHPTTCM